MIHIAILISKHENLQYYLKLFSHSKIILHLFMEKRSAVILNDTLQLRNVFIYNRTFFEEFKKHYPNIYKIYSDQYTDSNLITYLPMKHRNVIVQIGAGIGNRLFQIAFILNLKRKYEWIQVYYRDDSRKTHNVTMDWTKTLLKDVKEYKGDIKSCVSIREIHANIYDLSNIVRKISNLKPNVFGYMNWCFFQSHQYFEEISDKIKTLFTTFIMSKSNLSLLKGYENDYFIHIRGGDFLNPHNKQHYLDLKQYYINSIQHILSNDNLNTPIFYVITNDMVYARKIISFVTSKLKISIRFLDKISAFDSLGIMSLCKGGITSNSSFSWWGAFLNKNHDKIYMPDVWYSNRKHFKDIYFKGVNVIKIRNENKKILF